MTPYQIKKAVETYLSTNWSATSIRTINKDDAPALPFIECYFKPGNVTGLEINGVGERVGALMINIFTKKGVGTDEGLYYGGMLEDLFWHHTISNSNGNIVCENGAIMPYTSEIGIDEALQAYHHQTVIPLSIIFER